MRFALLALITLLAVPSLWAKDCVKPVTTIHEGDKAECDGFLFSKAKEKEVRYTKEQLDLKFAEINLMIKKSADQSKIIENAKIQFLGEQKKAKDWQDVAEKYTKKYEDQVSSRTSRDALFFGLGVAAAIVTGVGVVWIITHIGVTAGASAIVVAPL